MELARLEKQILHHVHAAFPIPWEKTDASEILTHEEKPLATVAALVAALPDDSSDAIESSLKRLLAFQLVKKVYLFTSEDYSEVQVSAGRRIRMRIAGPDHGSDGYQITDLGTAMNAKNVLDPILPGSELALVLRLCQRLPAAASILASRREGKQPFVIADEYDAQDLLHGVLRAYLKYSVHEEPLGKIGGARSGRADVAVEELGTVVELKYIHGPGDQKRIIDEFSNDLLIYTKWPHLKHFIYLVYNSKDLRDPEALDKLNGPYSLCGVDFAAHIVRA